MSNFKKTASVSDVLARAMKPRVAAASNALLQKQAENQLDPASEHNMEVPANAPVSQKMKQKCTDFASASAGSYGRQQVRDLQDQPNMGPIPDKAGSDQPVDRSSNNDNPTFRLYDVNEAIIEPTTMNTEPTSWAPVSDKLKLKETTAEYIQYVEKVADSANALIELILADSKTASARASNASRITGDDIIKAASGDAFNNMRYTPKEVLAGIVDDSIYSAEITALYCANAYAEAEKQANMDGEVPVEDVGGEAAMGAMMDPAGVEMGGVPDDEMPPELAEEMLAQSLAENGVDDEALGDEELGLDDDEELGLYDDDDELGLYDEELGLDDEVDPEVLELVEALSAEGFSDEEIIDALQELDAEEANGIDPEQAFAADEEALKEGSYKFASYIRRGRPRTPEQEKRAAMVRSAMRDFLVGPGTSNFN